MTSNTQAAQGFVPFTKRTNRLINDPLLEEAERKFRSQNSEIRESGDPTFLDKIVKVEVDKVKDFFNRLDKVFYGFTINYKPVESIKLRKNHDLYSGADKVISILELHIAPTEIVKRMGISRRYETPNHPLPYRPTEMYRLDIENLVINDGNPTSHSNLNVLESLNKDQPLFGRIILYNFPFYVIQETYEMLEEGIKESCESPVPMFKAEALAK